MFQSLLDVSTLVPLKGGHGYFSHNMVSLPALLIHYSCRIWLDMFKNWAVSPGSMCFGEDYDIPKKAAMTFPKVYIPGNCLFHVLRLKMAIIFGFTSSESALANLPGGPLKRTGLAMKSWVWTFLQCPSGNILVNLDHPPFGLRSHAKKTTYIV